MYRTSILPTPAIPRLSDGTGRTTYDLTHADQERILDQLARRKVLRPESLAASHVRSIFAAAPEALRVGRVARRAYVSRRTFGRHFRMEGLPCPMDWIALAKAIRAHRAIARGAKLRVAAGAAGYSDQFAMSNAIHRITGLRPSQLRDLRWDAFVDVWIARQRQRGELRRLSMLPMPTCPLCGRSAPATAA